MSSPTPEVFFVFNPSTGAPLTGGAGGMSFVAYKDDTGSNIAQPAISEIGGGAYKFTPVFSDLTHGIVYLLATAGNPSYIGRYMRPEDYAADSVPQVLVLAQRVKDFQEGKWVVNSTGPDANRLIVYASDGTTVLTKYDLKDKDGNPTFKNPVSRTPV